MLQADLPSPLIDTLPNGVRVVALPMPHLHTASVSVFVRVGSAHESRALNGAGMRQLEAGLAKLGQRMLPSHGNFVIVHVGDAAKVYQALLRQGVIVRPVANYGLPEWLRVTVGLPDENERFLVALGEALAR